MALQDGSSEPSLSRWRSTLLWRGPGRKLAPLVCTDYQAFGSRKCRGHEGRPGPLSGVRCSSFAQQRETRKGGSPYRHRLAWPRSGDLTSRSVVNPAPPTTLPRLIIPTGWLVTLRMNPRAEDWRDVMSRKERVRRGGGGGGGGEQEEWEGQDAGAICPMKKVGPIWAFGRTRLCQERDFPTQGR